MNIFVKANQITQSRVGWGGVKEGSATGQALSTLHQGLYYIINNMLARTYGEEIILWMLLMTLQKLWPSNSVC